MSKQKHRTDKHGRKVPRTARWSPYVDTMATVKLRATCLTPEEIKDTITPTQTSLQRLCEGVGTYDQFVVIQTAFLIGQLIEESGVVKGLHEHFARAEHSLDNIHARAIAAGTWQAPALEFHEIEALTTALDLHEFQLGQVSAGELHAITRKLTARTLCAGGTVERKSNADLLLTQAPITPTITTQEPA